MCIRHLILSLPLIMLMGLVGHATAETRHLRCTSSFTAVEGVETRLDTNGDNMSANATQGILICNGFRGLIHEVVELIPRPLTVCPKGPNMIESHISSTQGLHRSVTIHQKTGDQLFGQATSMVVCLDASNASHLTFNGTSEGIYVGGTGDYSDAQGTFTSHFSGSFLVYGFKDGVFGGFVQVTGDTEATLILPKGK
jgi:hypothetical protein